MKNLIAAMTTTLLFSNAFAATTATSQKSVKKSALRNISLSVELTTELKQDRETRDVEGTNNFFAADVGYRIDEKSKIVLMNSWSGKFREDKDSQINYDLVQLEYKRKIAKASKDGISLKFDGRASYTTNAKQRESYGTYGLVQARMYYGLPLSSKFGINKYVSYVRAEKYIIKDDNQRARDLGWRARIAPSYKPIRGLDISLITTYSGYRLNSSDLDEELEISPSVRYQYKKVAFIVSADFKPYDTKSGSFKFMEGFAERPTYSTNISFYAF